MANKYRSVKLRTARAAIQSYVRHPILIAFNVPSDLVQLCTTAYYYGPARPSATIPANMSLPTVEWRVTPQC